MRKIIVAVLYTGFVLVSTANGTSKSVKIEGPIVAPWVKGTLCARYTNKTERVKQCFNVAAGQSYVLENVPYHVKHIKIKRTFDKYCKTTRRAKKCKTAKGMFDLQRAGDTTLNLTYDDSHRTITKDYTIPPAEPKSNFGYPQPYGAATQQPNYRFQPDAMAV